MAVVLGTAPLSMMSLVGVVAGILTLGTGAFLAWRRPARKKVQDPVDVSKVFLFQGTDLVDANPRAEELLTLAKSGGSDWARMMSVLTHHFPNLADRLGDLDDRGSVGLRSRDGNEQLIASVIGDRIRITLTGTEDDERRILLEPLVFRSTLRELETLRYATDALPFPVWRQTPEGALVWANIAYRQAVGANGPGTGADAWPLPALFDADTLRDIANRPAAPRRVPPLRDPADGYPSMYECTVTQTEDDLLYSAVGIDATVEAENQLRAFMQTLTNTFSHLTIGLAIFDRQRRLAMFNPALTDLTALPVDFLTARPTLYSVLDRLRDRRMIPEPRDYGSWRRQIADLEAAALDGTYSETWSLPNNRTYRVTGRPHHGGAVAFIIEDISDEIALTRRFRSELELGQAVIDAIEDAIVVFLPSGDLSMVNLAYQKLWATDVGDTVDTPTVTEMSRLWMAKVASPVWGEIRDFVLHGRDRAAWEDTVILGGGGSLECRVAPLAGGSTLVSLRGVETAPPARLREA